MERERESQIEASRDPLSLIYPSVCVCVCVLSKMIKSNAQIVPVMIQQSILWRLYM